MENEMCGVNVDGFVEDEFYTLNGDTETIYLFSNSKLHQITSQQWNACIGVPRTERWMAILSSRCIRRNN